MDLVPVRFTSLFNQFYYKYDQSATYLVMGSPRLSIAAFGIIIMVLLIWASKDSLRALVQPEYFIVIIIVVGCLLAAVISLCILRFSRKWKYIVTKYEGESVLWVLDHAIPISDILRFDIEFFTTNCDVEEFLITIILRNQNRIVIATGIGNVYTTTDVITFCDRSGIAVEKHVK